MDNDLKIIQYNNLKIEFSPISKENIEEILKKQYEMFLDIHRDLGYESKNFITSRMNMQKKTLYKIAEYEGQIKEKNKIAKHSLNPAYFIKKKMDLDDI